MIGVKWTERFHLINYIQNKKKKPLIIYWYNTALLLISLIILSEISSSVIQMR